jgi:hypothetical protein
MFNQLPPKGRRKNGRFFFYTFLTAFQFTCSFLTYAQTNLPLLQNVKKPVPAITAPGDPFTPPMSGVAAANAPQFAEWTRTAGPDETIVATGFKFSNFTGAQEGSDSRFVLYGNNRRTDAMIQRLDGDKAILTMDDALNTWSMYLLWPRNENGYGFPVAINKTEAWWVGPNKVAKGSTTSVYGRNLAHNNGTSASYIYIKPVAAAGTFIVPYKVNPYKVDFTIPPTMANGTYEVWTHNGHGGDYGWSGPLMLQVVDVQQWNGTVFNVRNFGAQGNGIADDTGPIRTAISAAGQVAGSTLYFPSGTYMISNDLSVGNNIRWMGDGRDASIIRMAPNYSSTVSTVIYGDVTNVEFKDLGFDGNHQNRTALEKPINFRGSTDIRITNVNFSFQDFEVMDVHLAERVIIKNTTFIGSTIFLGDGSQIFMDSCTFKLTNDAETMILSWGGEGVSLTNSTASDLDNSDPDDGAGWGKGRFFTGSGNFGANRHTYLGNNVTADLTVRPDGPNGADQNSGEQFLWEGNGTQWTGIVQSSTATVTNVSGNLNLNGKHIAVIVQGKGRGQSRRINGYTVNSVTLEEPWLVIPDATSVMNIGPYTEKVVIYNNYLDAKSRAATSPTHIASTGIQPFGGVFNMIADNNILNETRVGIGTWATQHSDDLDPTYFSLFVNNKMINNRWGILHNHSITNPTNSKALLGIIYRYNTVENPIESAVFNQMNGYNEVLYDAIVYEYNQFLNVSRGLYSETGPIQNQVLYSNTFLSLGSGPGPALVLTPGMALRRNDYQNFNTFFQGSIGGAVIEAPYHVVQLDAVAGAAPATGEFILWNSGSQMISWTIADNAPWLTLTPQSGDLANEVESDTMVLSANPLGLLPGLHTANLTATNGTTTEFYTVLFNVRAASPLPLDMLAFTARPAGRTVILYWLTDNEVNTKEFKVEYSTDGVRWSEIALVPARGSGSGTYTLNHVNPIIGQNHYRIRSVDMDGKFAFSPVRTVPFGRDIAPAFQIIPNPADDKTTLYFTKPLAAPDILVHDAAGKLIRKFRLAGTVNSYLFPTASLPGGTYIVTVQTKDFRLTEKLTVQ